MFVQGEKHLKMLFYNFKRMFALRDISKPYTFLKRHGFSHSYAHRIANNDVDSLSMYHLEKLCLIFSCTPNDLIAWKPKNEKENHADNPLRALQKETKKVDIRGLISKMPLDKIDELHQLIEGLKKKQEGE